MKLLKRIWWRAIAVMRGLRRLWINIPKRVKLRSNLRRNVKRLRNIRRSLGSNCRIRAIFLTEHIGDIVACEPVARYLRAQYPEDYIVWFLYKPYLELLASHPEIDAIMTVTCLTECQRLSVTGSLDQIIDLHVGQRLCPWFGTIYEKFQGDRSITMYNNYFHGSILESFCKSAGIAPLHCAPIVHFPVTVREQVSQFIPSGPFIVIHAASNVSTRDWQTEKWKALLRELSTNYKLTFIEVGLHARVGGELPGVINYCGKLSLIELAELIRRASGFIGIDSGPAHLANAVRCPSIILLGHYGPYKRYMPYTGFLRDHSEEMLIFWDGPAREIPVAEVEGRFHKIFGKFSPVAAREVAPDER